MTTTTCPVMDDIDSFNPTPEDRFIAWATTGGGAGKIGGLFDSMIDLIVERASSTF